MWNNGDVYFNHSIRPSGPSAHYFTAEFIREAYQRAAGIFFPLAFPGADIGIPVRLHTANNVEYCFLLVQVKNKVNGDASPYAKLTAVKSIEYAFF